MKKIPPISDKFTPAQAQRRMDYWGIPDWRFNVGYPVKSPKTTKEELRWEFLRRDDTYRELWRDWENGLEVAPCIYNLMDYGLYDLLDPRLPYKALNKKRDHIFQQYPAVLNSSGEITWSFPETTESEDNDIESILNDPDTSRFVDVRFDLDRPLSPQLESEAMKKALEARQKERTGKILRHRVIDEPFKYLRAIDAFFLGVKKTTIGKEIFGAQTKHAASTRGNQVAKTIQRLWLDF